MSSKIPIENGGQTFNVMQNSEEVVPRAEKFLKTRDSAELTKYYEHTSDVSEKHSVSRFKKLFPVSINKQLIPLKIALFCWFGAASTTVPFVAVYFKQLGLTISDLSIIYVLLPPTQFLGPAIAAVFADKLGRSKPVLIGCLVLVMISVTAMIFVPSDKIHICPKTQMALSCDHQNPTEMTFEGWAACGIPPSQRKQAECDLQCSEDANETTAEYCDETDDSMCSTLPWKNTSKHFIISVLPERELSNNTFQQCSYNVNLFHLNNTLPANVSCNFIHLVRGCNFTCFINFTTEKQPWNSECKTRSKNRSQFLGFSFFLIVLYNTAFATSFRFLDVTVVSMIKKHNSNYGQQKFWSTTGILVFSPLAGYIVDATSPTGGLKNYHHAFYLFEFMTVITIIVVWVLDVEIATPAKNMWKKSINVLKNIDIVVFMFVVIMMGTLWGFTKMLSFWYLEELHAPSTLLGLLPAVDSLIGLPFLMTSPWWIEKFGSKTLLIATFLAYVLNCVGYSFLTDPWLALVYELAGIFTQALSWVAIIIYSAEIAPEGLLATTLSVMGGLHFGIGKGFGSIIGGQIMSNYDAPTAYRVMAIMSAITALFYALYLYFQSRYIKKPRTVTVEEVQDEVMSTYL